MPSSPVASVAGDSDMTDSTAGNSTQLKMLRVWSGIGSTVLIVGLVIIVAGVIIWQPLNIAPALWTTGTGIIFAIGLAVTVIATSMLASRTRRR